MNAAVLDEDLDEGPPAPRYNADLEGQQAAEEILAEGFASGKLAHAWMLTGPKGIGKATLAYRFARHVLASGIGGNNVDTGPSLFGADDLPNDSEVSPLYLTPDTPIFQRVAAGGHADLMSVERGLNSTGKLRSDIVVGDVRGINRFLNLTAGEGGWRVVIVDSADEMNINAANALLKVLEEPPSRALLVLVCHNPGRMLPTIRSRCRKLRLADLDESIVTELLGRYLPDLDKETRSELAALSEGSIGRALELAQADGAELQRQIMTFMAQMPSLNIPDLQDFGATMSKADAIPRFETMADLLRRCLARLVRHASGADILGPVNAEEQALYARLAAAGGLDRWLQVWDKSDDLLRRTNRINLDRKQVILNIFLNISQAARGDT